MIDRATAQALGTVKTTIYTAPQDVMINLINVFNLLPSDITVRIAIGPTTGGETVLHNAFPVMAGDAESVDGVVALKTGDQLLMSCSDDNGCDVWVSITGENV